MGALKRAALGLLCALLALPALAGPVRQIDPFWPASTPTSGCWTAKVEGAHTLAPDSAPETFDVIRQGFDTNAQPTLYKETVTRTTRVRLPYPQTSTTITNLYGDRDALSKYLFQSDFVPGVKNLCTQLAPAPVALFVTPDRQLVGDTIGGDTVPVEVAAYSMFARNGSQVAAVVFRICDTVPVCVTSTVSSMTASTFPGDRHTLDVYKLPSTSISTLAAGSKITIDAEVYPWIGTGASVLRSTDSTQRREFSTRYFRHDATRAASPYIIYVCAAAGGSCAGAGNDTTCIASTTDATAYGSPCATFQGAMNELRDGVATYGRVDGVRVRLNAGYVPANVSSGNLTQSQACMVVERDPGVTKATAQIQMMSSATNWILSFTGLDASLSQGCITFSDLSFVRTNNGSLRGYEAFFVNSVDFDNNSTASTYLNTTGAAHDWHYGTTFTNMAASAMQAQTSPEHRMWRGISVDMGGAGIENWATLASDVDRPVYAAASGRGLDGGMLVSTVHNRLATANFTIATPILKGFALVGNVFEFTSATASHATGVSHDSQTNSTSQFIWQYNTYAGFYTHGRVNVFYDEGSTSRVNRYVDCRGNLLVAIYTKGDVFRAAVESGADASYRTGNWGFLHGVGCQGNWSQYQSNTPLGGNEAQLYPGLGSSLGTSTTTPQMAETGWADYQATASGPTSDTGDGDYDLDAGAPMEGIVTTPMLPHDIEGVSRPTADTPGAYIPGGMAANDNLKGRVIYPLAA